VVSRRANRQQQALLRERERRRGQDQRRHDREIDAEQAATAAGVTLPLAPVDPDTAQPLASGRRVAGQPIACGWCGQPIVLRHTGRMPKWCSAACRQRAWEQTRAAASGHAAVRVVDRYVAAVPADGPGWITQLSALTAQITNAPGQITDRDLDHLSAALELAQAAVTGRTRWRSHHRY
jgi:hypothetical protein